MRYIKNNLILLCSIFVLLGCVGCSEVVFNLPELVVLLAGLCTVMFVYLAALWLLDRNVLLEFQTLMRIKETDNSEISKINGAVSE